MDATADPPVPPTPGAAADALRRVLSVPLVLRLWADGGPGGGEPPEASFPGYAARVLRPADWSVADGWPAVARQPAQEFRAVAGPGPGPGPRRVRRPRPLPATPAGRYDDDEAAVLAALELFGWGG